MDSTIPSTATAHTNKADEVLSISPRECDAEKAAANDDEKCLLNGLELPNGGNSSHNSQRNHDLSNNYDSQQTPNIAAAVSMCQSPNSTYYNEYVNGMFDKSQDNNNNNNNNSSKNEEESEEEVKPLLKSIVKSPSGNLNGLTLPLNGKIKNKQLKWEATSKNPTKPPANITQDGVNTQSTSLDSSDDQEQIGTPLGSTTGSTSTSSSSEEDDDDFSDTAYKVHPDGGYGWLIVFVSFIINMIADGITFSFGIFNTEFLKYFGDSKGKTAWISSIFMAVPLLSGPIASYLTDRYGCRKVTIVGAITATIGFLLSAASNSMEMLFVTFGVISGFGLSLCYVAAVVIVAYYFDKKRSFATGISVCGSGIGTLIFPPLIQYLIDEYGWRGCTVILAGILLNMCVCGALMRELEWTTHRAKQKRKHRKQIKENGNVSFESCSITNSTNTAGGHNGTDSVNDNCNDACMIEAEYDPHLFSSLVNLPTFAENGVKEPMPIGVLEQLSKHRNFHKFIHNYPYLLGTRSLSSSGQVLSANDPAAQILSPTTMKHQTSNKNRKHRHTIQIGESETDVADKWLRQHPNTHRHVMNILKDPRHSLTYRGAMLNINKYRLRASSCPDIYRDSTITASDTETTTEQLFSEFKKLFKDILDFSFFLDIRFLLFAISNFVLYMWYDVVYVYLPDWAGEHKVSTTDASVLISLIGIVNMFGEIALGWAGDRKELNPNIVYAICMGFCGVSVIMIPFFQSYTWMCILASAFGLFIAANYSLTSIILVNLVDLDRFTNAYGLLLLVQGIGNLVGPPLAGLCYDETGEYNLSFFLAGAFIILSGALLLILPILNRYKKYQKRKESKSEVIPNGDLKETSKMNGVYV